MDQTRGCNRAMCQNLVKLCGRFGALAPAEVSQAPLVDRGEKVELCRPSRFEVFHCPSWIALDHRAQHLYPLVLGNSVLRKLLVKQLNSLQHAGPVTGASENRGDSLFGIS